jgi:hypothetical protein
VTNDHLYQIRCTSTISNVANNHFGVKSLFWTVDCGTIVWIVCNMWCGVYVMKMLQFIIDCKFWEVNFSLEFHAITLGQLQFPCEMENKGKHAFRIS